MDFKIGDVVQLKSGSPRMVISEISENGSAHCQWFDKAKHSSANFVIEILELAADDDSQTLARGRAKGINVDVLMDVVEAMRGRRDAGTLTDAKTSFPANPA
jgi:uncharacterized protein YodC (DUF2158 family)